MSVRRTTACAVLLLAAGCGAARGQARPSPGPGGGPARDGYENCTQGGSIALSVTMTDAATGRGLPWRVVPYATVEWRAGRSAGTAYDRPNFGPGRDYPAGGTADGYAIGVMWGRPGAYRLTVRAPGYQPWDTTEVRVAQAEPGTTPFPPYAPAHCATGPEVVVVARLRPAPPAPHGAP